MINFSATEVSWKPNNFQVSESSQTNEKETAQSIALAIDQLASSVVAEILDLVSDIDANQIPVLVDSDLVNVIVVSIFQMCTIFNSNETVILVFKSKTRKLKM